MVSATLAANAKAELDQLLHNAVERGDLPRVVAVVAAYARFREAAARYGENAGEMTVCKLIEEDAGVELCVAGEWVAPWEVKHPADSST